MNNAFQNIIEIISQKNTLDKEQKDCEIASEKYFEKNPHLSEAYKNAIRHISASMYFTQKYGPDKTKFLGDMYERANFLFNDPRDNKVDLLNNTIGRRISPRYDNSTIDKSLNNAYQYILKGGDPVLRYSDKRINK